MWSPDVRFQHNNNNNNSYITLYPVNIYKLVALHYQHQNPLDNQKSTSIINAYININMTKSQDGKKKLRKGRQSTSTVNAYIDMKAFHTRSNKYKYYKIMHTSMST